MTGASDTLGLIAGQGRLPFMVAAGAKAAGRSVVVVALRGFADPELRALADRWHWSGLLRLGRWIRLLRRAGAAEAVLVGRVRKSTMFDRPRWRQWLTYLPDWTTIRVWYFATRDKRNDTLLGAVADAMQRKGITLIDSTRYCPDDLAPAGVLTRRAPSAAQRADIELGWQVARRMGELDVGQAVAVRERDIIAVEAIEGTDAMIRRAGELARRGWTLVKVAKPDQDMRFDVPTVGPETIRTLHAAGGRCLAVEAGKTLIIDRAEMLRLADELGVAVVGVSAES